MFFVLLPLGFIVYGMDLSEERISRSNMQKYESIYYLSVHECMFIAADITAVSQCVCVRSITAIKLYI